MHILIFISVHRIGILQCERVEADTHAVQRGGGEAAPRRLLAGGALSAGGEPRPLPALGAARGAARGGGRRGGRLAGGPAGEGARRG